MVKKGLIFLSIMIISCTTNHSVTKKKTSLYEILSTQNDGGASIKFYEVLTEENEIKMLIEDKTISRKIKEDAIVKSNFIILNAGPTTENINKITIEKVFETPNSIEVYVKDNQENISYEYIDEFTRYPFSVVRINSKKPIVFK